uniref:Gamma-secretase subunit PEN-2 n=1 Tax=Cacopsylla melanoneura TaxID=428564 RepID=A0A8D9BFC3_9HEMI
MSTQIMTGPNDTQMSPPQNLTPAGPKRANPMKSLKVCRYYFLGGFFFLPCLWLVNVLFFLPEAFGHGDLPSGDPTDDDNYLLLTDAEKEARRKRIRGLARRYVIVSAVGALAWVVVLGVWNYLYQTRRSEWGEWGDAVSAIIPRGKP